MGIKVNCKFYDKFGRCSNLKVKRSFWGLGIRECRLADNPFRMCKYKRYYPKPDLRVEGVTSR